MSFRRYLTTLMCVYLAVAVVAGAGSTLLLLRAGDLRAQAADLRSAQLASLELESTLLDQETGARGFVITGDDRFLQPYTNGQRSEATVEQSIHALVAGDDALEAALADAMTAARTWREQAAEPEIAMRRTDEVTALEMVAAGTGKRLFDESRVAQGALEQLLASRENQRSAEVAQARNWFAVVALAALGLTAVITITAGWLFVRRLIRPLDRLTASVKAVSVGNLGGRIDATGTVEMAEVGAAVASMRDQIVQLLQESVAQRQALEQEAILTTQLAISLAGTTAELPDGWTSSTFQRPAEGVVAGDCFSVELLSPNIISLVVLDISGHGAKAALQALKARSILSAGLRTGEPPHRVLELLSAAWTDELFVSTFVATIDTDQRRMTYANAGHPAAIVCSASGLVELGATGPIVMPPLAGWTTASVQLAPGDVMVIATDGLTEARRRDGEFYGEQRLRDMLARADPHHVLSELMADVDAFMAGQPARDDITVVALRLDPDR